MSTNKDEALEAAAEAIEAWLEGPCTCGNWKGRKKHPRHFESYDDSLDTEVAR